MLYVGGYTAELGQGEGIVGVPDDGVARLLARTRSPSFLARHPRLPVLYSVTEADEGAVSSWAITADGLRRTGSGPTGAGLPCHLAVAGEYLVTANFGGGISVHRLAADGAVVVRTDLVRPRQPSHPHQTTVFGATLLVTDREADLVRRFRLVSGRLVATGEARLPAGTGPRHLARGGDGRWYLSGELSGTLTVLDEALDVLAQVPASGGDGRNEPSDVVAGNGVVYVANRGPDTVSVFRGTADGVERVAEVPCGGKWPRHLSLRDGVLWVANQHSHGVAVFRVDPGTGIPHHVNTIATPSPSCVLPPP
ncbi:MAG TPA: beta-propeller fold lactonase family protein [Pseudonocardiaceae bacterium]